MRKPIRKDYIEKRIERLVEQRAIIPTGTPLFLENVTPILAILFYVFMLNSVYQTGNLVFFVIFVVFGVFTVPFLVSNSLTRYKLPEGGE